MLAQLVPQRELGKVYGLLAILDAMLPFLGKSIFLCFIPTIISALPLANPLWDSTIDTMPGAFCLLNAGVRAVPKRFHGSQNAQVMGLLGGLYLIVWLLQRRYNLQAAASD